MGGMCSKSNDVGEDLDTSRHVVATSATLSNSTTKNKTPTTSTSTTTTKNEDIK
jgi:hypothetical protein